MRNLTFQTDYQIELLAWCTNLSRLQMIWDYYVLQRQWIYWRNWMYLVLSLCDAWDGCIYPLFAGFDSIGINSIDSKKSKFIENGNWFETKKIPRNWQFFWNISLRRSWISHSARDPRSKVSEITLDLGLDLGTTSEPRDDLRDQPLAVKKLFNRQVTVSQGFSEV